MPRDRALEREFLERAARDVEFAPRVAARLEQGEAEYGEDGFRRRSLRELIDEIADEALDVAGWGALAVQLDLDRLPAYNARQVVHYIELAAELAASIDLLMKTARSWVPHHLDQPQGAHTTAAEGGEI